MTQNEAVSCGGGGQQEGEKGSVPDQLSDSALIKIAASGDSSAFGTIVNRHAGAVLRLARALTSDLTLAEDVAQQTFMAAFRAVSGFRGEASPRTWLLTITRNTALRMRAQHAKEEPEEAPLSLLGAEAGWGAPDPETLAILAERQQLLARALASLSPQDREVLILRDIEQLTGEEAAHVLGVQLRAMKSRLHRARLRLAVALRELNVRHDGGEV